MNTWIILYIIISIILLVLLFIIPLIYQNEHFNSENRKRANDWLMYTLIKVTNILDKHNIEYWLEAGTLLGCMRHGTILPHDNDVDLSARIEEWSKIKELHEEFKKEGLILGRSNDRAHIEHKNVTSIIVLDIYLWRTRGDELIYKGEDRHLLYNQVFPLSTRRMYNKRFPTPNDPKQYLEEYYGKDCINKINKSKDKERAFDKYPLLPIIP